MTTSPSHAVWLDTADVASLTRTPESTVRSWRRRRIGPAWCRVGRRVLYDARDVDAFIRSGRQETSGVVAAPGPERPSARTPITSNDDVRSGGRGGRRLPVGPGALSTVHRTPSTGAPGVSTSGDVPTGLTDCRDDVA